jgi:hypothetical protein
MKRKEKKNNKNCIDREMHMKMPTLVLKKITPMPPVVTLTLAHFPKLVMLRGRTQKIIMTTILQD